MMKYDILTFELPHGQMTIYNDRFFPCSRAAFHKLFKIIRQHRENDLDRIKSELNTHFIYRLTALEGEKGDAAAYQKQKLREIEGIKKNIEMLKQVV